MEIIRNLKENSIKINDNNSTLMELFFFGDDAFCIAIYSDKEITIPRDLDECFYNNFSALLENKYTIPDSSGANDECYLLWYSDSYKDQEEEGENRTNRLAISKKEKSLCFYSHTPHLKKHGLSRDLNLTFFIPNNGKRESTNIDTSNTLQKDIISVFTATLNQEDVKFDEVNKKCKQRIKV